MQSVKCVQCPAQARLIHDLDDQGCRPAVLLFDRRVADVCSRALLQTPLQHNAIGCGFAESELVLLMCLAQERLCSYVVVAIAVFPDRYCFHRLRGTRFCMRSLSLVPAASSNDGLYNAAHSA